MTRIGGSDVKSQTERAVQHSEIAKLSFATQNKPVSSKDFGRAYHDLNKIFNNPKKKPEERLEAGKALEKATTSVFKEVLQGKTLPDSLRKELNNLTQLKVDTKASNLQLLQQGLKNNSQLALNKQAEQKIQTALKSVQDLKKLVNLDAARKTLKQSPLVPPKITQPKAKEISLPLPRFKDDKGQTYYKLPGGEKLTILRSIEANPKTGKKDRFFLGAGATGEAWIGELTLKDGKKIQVGVKKLITPTEDKNYLAKKARTTGVRPVRDPQAVKNESAITDRLHHRNIIATYGTHEVDAKHTTKMLLLTELADRDLFSKMGRGYNDKSETIHQQKQCAQTLDSMLDGLAYMHSENILHCDIKPENFLVAKNDKGVDDVKFADFGLAVDVAKTKGEASGFRGTSGYRAPEVEAGQTYDAKADVFSLGVTAYEMLHGIIPNQIDAKGKAIDLPPQVNTLLYSKMPDPKQSPLDYLIWQMTSEEATDRPTAADARKQLNTFMGRLV